MYICHSAFVYDCTTCPTRCDGVSKGHYNFINDCSFSEHYEQMVIDRINLSGRYFASKSFEPAYPDITLTDPAGNVCKYVEVKVQQRTFMNVQTCLPSADLMPSETVALNESDLVRYIHLQQLVQLPIILLWVLQNRLCMVPDESCLLFYQQLSELEKIYSDYGTKRRFRRKSGEGDVVNGEHKGVVVNYHFSLK
jgi:hypothetical protein